MRHGTIGICQIQPDHRQVPPHNPRILQGLPHSTEVFNTPTYSRNPTFLDPSIYISSTTRKIFARVHNLLQVPSARFQLLLPLSEGRVAYVKFTTWNALQCGAMRGNDITPYRCTNFQGSSSKTVGGV
eukprot:sb/3475367/